MSTRSRIGVLNADWSIRSIYTHWGGYPSHHYPILRDHYTDPVKIKALLSLGDLSSLGEDIGRKTNFEDPARGQCVAYMRDRGDAEGKSEFSRTPSQFEVMCAIENIEFAYLWSGTEWVVHTITGFGIPQLQVVKP